MAACTHCGIELELKVDGSSLFMNNHMFRMFECPCFHWFCPGCEYHPSELLVCCSLQIVPGLPKTRSGKIMRRILRKIAANRHDELGDVSTLADPSVVERIVQKHTQNNEE